jgi:hypothetical protein
MREALRKNAAVPPADCFNNMHLLITYPSSLACMLLCNQVITNHTKPLWHPAAPGTRRNCAKATRILQLYTRDVPKLAARHQLHQHAHSRTRLTNRDAERGADAQRT